MTIQFACSCGRKLQAQEEHAGRRVKCPACGAETTVPGDAAAVQPAEVVPSRPAPVQAEEPPPPRRDEERPRRRRREDDDERDDDRPRRRRREDDDDDRSSSDEKTSGKAVAALVLGLLSCCLTGFPAIILGILSLIDISNSRGRLRGKGMATVGMVLGGFSFFVVPILIGILVPAVQKTREAAARIQSGNNLHQMSLAMVNDADSNRGRLMPPAICDKNGKPLLSWRVAILPYIEQENLYRQFKLDEPWDGPNNSRLIPLMPKTYSHPGDAAANGLGLTHYRVFTGRHTPFPDALPPFPPGRSPLFYPAGFTDGTANTILIVEAADAVTWTKPDELPYEPNKPLPKFGLIPGRPFNAAMADGSVRAVAPSVSERTLRAAITPADNDILGPDW